MEKIKQIVSGFIKVPPEQIGPGTPINRSAVRSSILLHRMYARLADEGIQIADYNNINVFGDLFSSPSAGNGHPMPGPFSSDPGGGPATSSWSSPIGSPATVFGSPGIGIDIEDIASLPKTTDFRKDEFYKMNFSPEEIAYCILRQDPYASFTGLFAAKEAIVKAGGQPDGRPFDTIRITHSAEGKPLHPGYAISISHSAGIAVAVAVRRAEVLTGENFGAAGPAIPPARGKTSWVAWLALLLGLAALSVVLIHRA